MAQQNQLLFNLGIPCNPQNMVTKFHNPGPVIIERLAGSKQTKPEVTGERSEQPVVFNVISKEKIAFAMQLARRDMKNKIQEQKQHHRQQVQEKGELAKPRKNLGKKKKEVEKTSKSQHRPHDRLSKKSNTNAHKKSNNDAQKKSLKTQTPSNGLPGLVLLSHDQPCNIEREAKRGLTKEDSLSKPNSTLRNINLQQKQEIARLKRELQTYMDQMNTSKRTESVDVKSSPDRTAMLRAGLESLMRAKPNRVERPEVRKSRQQRKERKHIQSSSVILPMSVRARHHNKELHEPVEGSMHFTKPTKSSTSKAIPAGDVVRRERSRTLSKGEVKPSWAPPGSPQSFHRVRLSKHVRAPSHGDSDLHVASNVESQEGRERTIDYEERRLQQEQEYHSDSSGDRDEEMRMRLSKHVRAPSHGTSDLVYSKESLGDKSCRTRISDIGEHVSQHKEEYHSHSAGHRGEENAGARLTQEGSASHAYKSSAESEASGNSSRMKSFKPRSTQDSCFPPSIESATQHTDMKDKVLTLLVDDVLEDVVQEFERLNHDTMLPGQNQIADSTPTFENLMQELEYMEMEEERIRQRWKQVKYHDPQVSKSNEGHESRVNEINTMGSLLDDAQRMERLNSAPLQHSIVFTNTQHSGNQNRSNGFDRLSELHNPVHEEELRIVQPSNDSIHLETAGQPINVNSIPNDQETEQPSERIHGSRREGDGIPLSAPGSMVTGVHEGREAFETHLKLTSHFNYGTFDPWKLVEKIADDLVEDIILDITNEVSDVIGNYVETIYATEFEMKTEDVSMKEKARKALFT
ncbi:protein moonraker-like [Lytechinus variegatus]|uniref:protein moonraker-like n=1 Tax=Lytechinus variegatus TaxID=7654 RepID=UPI001BB11776|nr:protein moonraker-like [Lytechinus variegatus]